MPTEFEFFGPGHKPALLAVTSPNWRELARSGLETAGYKVHAAETHEQFVDLFTRASYQAVIIEDVFGGSADNPTLHWIRLLQMSQRRHAVFFLTGENWETLNPLLAFQQSVHAVLNYTAMDQLARLVEKTAADTESFLRPMRSAQERLFKAG